MSYCINPECLNYQKSNDILVCQDCGSDLLIDGKYIVVKKLGNGGFGTTYEVRQQERTKVLKVLKLNQPIALKLFQKEAEALKQLNHPGIPKVETDGYFLFYPHNIQEAVRCLVMEKIEGENLEHLLERRGGPIKQELAVKWLIQLTSILHEVHKEKFFHRDIKPANIMLRPNGQLVLIDFGTVKEIKVNTAINDNGRKAGTVAYTPGYAPPEQENGHTVPQSDFFALGRTFIHLLTNRHPLDFYDPYQDRLNWHDAASDVSPLLIEFIDRLTARLPSQRPKNTEQILLDLLQIEKKLFWQEVVSWKKTHLTAVAQIGQKQPQLTENSEIKNQKRKLFLPQNLQEHSHGIYALSISGNGKYLASSSRDDTVKVWHLKTGKKLHTLSGHDHWVYSVAISNDGQYLVTGSWDKTIKVWYLETGREIQTLRGHQHWVYAVAIGPDGRYIASGGREDHIKIWHMQTGQEICNLIGHTDWVNSIAIAPNGRYLASASRDRTIKLWNTVTAEEIYTFIGHTDWVNAVAISEDGRYLASGSWDKTVKIWHLATGKEYMTLEGHSDWVSAIAITRDGRYLVSGSWDNTIKIWDLAIGKEIVTLVGHADSVRSVAVSPDGKYLASGSWDRTIKIWDLPNATEITTLQGHTDCVNSVAFSSDERYLASGSDDRTIGIWKAGA
jgi:WD40 repeat protein/tRNA A-37 threonylcarbamoyl transferase component Bud32